MQVRSVWASITCSSSTIEILEKSWNMCKVNGKDIKTSSLTSFWYCYCQLWILFHTSRNTRNTRKRRGICKVNSKVIRTTFYCQLWTYFIPLSLSLSFSLCLSLYILYTYTHIYTYTHTHITHTYTYTQTNTDTHTHIYIGIRVLYTCIHFVYLIHNIYICTFIPYILTF